MAQKLRRRSMDSKRDIARRAFVEVLAILANQQIVFSSFVQIEE
jgi:hypothetical protein